MRRRARISLISLLSGLSMIGCIEKPGAELTLQHVMRQLLVDMQRLQKGIMTRNGVLVQQAAHAIAHHPAPKDGIKPYLRKNVERVKAEIPAIDQALHGAAKKLANNAQTMTTEQQLVLYNKIATACVGCHALFRDQ